MSSTSAFPQPRGLGMALSWPRVAYTVVASTLLGVLISPAWVIPLREIVVRAILVGMFALLAFALFERWPARLPAWVARWVMQIVAVVAAVPLGVFLVYGVLSLAEREPFWHFPGRVNGFFMLSITGIMLAPWLAMSALIRQRDEAARAQALAFELERSELARQALDARLRLLQAQVEPHFLFNTLANVRELVIGRSPQAPAVLDSLIAYLRAAVPRLHEPAATIAQELQLVRAYLDLMHMRMPDRLQFSVDADPAAGALRCPPTTLLTLVENAVRHGIDPGEDGGRIDVRVRLEGNRCRAQVVDTGVGLRGSPGGLGTGLATLLERLRLAFDGDAQLRLAPGEPRGVRAELDFPAQVAKP